ncbi:hypothetical protein AWM79_21175 [Pseudomonas agarici]|uniref:FecR protein domain-containing protein n=1 Tax=Pseudomonas agarici TaxID=46677 RepID=A0A0X1T6P4_PSEAA|nr:FecR domain-containing protein [Pseudomonas agarici]AMB87663.1 hypothetical protein AWM79_21175 [Pseudomonas agarici]
MPDSSPLPPVSQASLEQAAEWLLRLETAPECFDDFDLWLHSQPEHFVAWARVNQAVVALAEQPATGTGHWPATSPPRSMASTTLPRPRYRLRRRRLVAACASVCAVALVLLLNPGWHSDYSTGTGQTRLISLADGSQLTLAPQSAVDVNFAGPLRQVKLLRGEAFFEVVHDVTRPFEVQHNDTAVRVLGTAFDVAQNEAGLKVEVREGAVGVTHQGQPYRLSPGQRLWIERRNGRVSQTQIATQEIGGWIDGPQFFENASVAQVVEQLRRYQRGWIVLDENLAGQRVTGLYDLRDTQRALRALVAPLGGEISQYSPLLSVIRKK